jgi:hypothetical protein
MPMRSEAQARKEVTVLGGFAAPAQQVFLKLRNTEPSQPSRVSAPLRIGARDTIAGGIELGWRRLCTSERHERPTTGGRCRGDGLDDYCPGAGGGTGCHPLLGL